MGKEITDLKPQILWKNFYDLTQIPRPSKKEKAVIKHIKEFADKLGLQNSIDNVGNLLVCKPANKHNKTHKTIVLQAHVDMVPQKNNNKVHHFEADPIETIIDGEWVKANDTTLGADNGIGVAAMMAILESNNVQHGSIEALFTINEEAGMDGAFGLREGLLKGKYLINLDSEEEGELFVGCAGGIDANINWNYSEERFKNGGNYLKIDINGLKGGHSGLDINLGRANSNKLMTQLLILLSKKYNIGLHSFAGGDMRNAIPREANVIIALEKDQVPLVEREIKTFEKSMRELFKGIEDKLSISFVEFEGEFQVMNNDDLKNFLKMLRDCPNGVIDMSKSMPDMVETSTNLSIVKADNGKVIVQCLLRSSDDEAKKKLANRVGQVFRNGGANVGFAGDYPGWQPNPDSYLLKKCTEVSERIFNRTPSILVMHAGLECGIIGAKYPGMDMISLGPTIKHPHSPNEKVNIASVKAFWNYLVTILESINN